MSVRPPHQKMCGSYSLCRKAIAVLSVLPLAVPSYLSAYAFVEFFSFTGPLQESLRALTGWQSARDYWFPSIRNTGGAVLVLSVVFYPYVFLAVVALLKLQGNRLVEASRALGRGPVATLLRVLLPALRPAIAAGVVLALMETLNDIGAVEYLGVETLTFTIFDTWLSRRDIAGAAQLTMVLLIFVFVLVLTERWARRQRQAQSSSARAAATAARVRAACARRATQGHGFITHFSPR